MVSSINFDLTLKGKLKGTSNILRDRIRGLEIWNDVPKHIDIGVVKPGLCFVFEMRTCCVFVQGGSEPTILLFQPSVWEGLLQLLLLFCFRKEKKRKEEGVGRGTREEITREGVRGGEREGGVREGGTQERKAITTFQRSF